MLPSKLRKHESRIGCQMWKHLQHATLVAPARLENSIPHIQISLSHSNAVMLRPPSSHDNAYSKSEVTGEFGQIAQKYQVPHSQIVDTKIIADFMTLSQHANPILQ